MTKLCSAFGLLLLCFVMTTVLPAQQMAPRETVSAQVGKGKVTIEYGRPSLKGRNVSELLAGLPADRMWRAGSEMVTTLLTDVPLFVGGKSVPAGKFSIYIHCPEDGSYSLVLNKVLGQPLKNIYAAAPPQLANAPWPHMNYTEEIGKQEVARIEMKSSKGSSPVDLFTIALEPASEGATLKMSWGTEVWTVDVKPDAGTRRPSEGS